MIARRSTRPIVVERLGHPRRLRTARRMAAWGWPAWRICLALGLSRRRLRQALDASSSFGLVGCDQGRLGGSALWTDRELDLIRSGLAETGAVAAAARSAGALPGGPGSRLSPGHEAAVAGRAS